MQPHEQNAALVLCTGSLHWSSALIQLLTAGPDSSGAQQTNGHRITVRAVCLSLDIFRSRGNDDERVVQVQGSTLRREECNNWPIDISYCKVQNIECFLWWDFL